MTRDDLVQRLSALRPWLTQQGVERLRLFGSFARDEAAEDSDIDLVATFDRPISLLEMIRLETELGDRLGRRVDLATDQGLKPRVRQRIEREAIDA